MWKPSSPYRSGDAVTSVCITTYGDHERPEDRPSPGWKADLSLMVGVPHSATLPHGVRPLEEAGAHLRGLTTEGCGSPTWPAAWETAGPCQPSNWAFLGHREPTPHAAAASLASAGTLAPAISTAAQVREACCEILQATRTHLSLALLIDAWPDIAPHFGALGKLPVAPARPAVDDGACWV